MGFLETRHYCHLVHSYIMCNLWMSQLCKSCLIHICLPSRKGNMFLYVVRNLVLYWLKLEMLLVVALPGFRRSDNVDASWHAVYPS